MKRPQFFLVAIILFMFFSALALANAPNSIGDVNQIAYTAQTTATALAPPNITADVNRIAASTPATLTASGKYFVLPITGAMDVTCSTNNTITGDYTNSVNIWNGNKTEASLLKSDVILTPTNENSSLEMTALKTATNSAKNTITLDDATSSVYATTDNSKTAVRTLVNAPIWANGQTSAVYTLIDANGTSSMVFTANLASKLTTLIANNTTDAANDVKESNIISVTVRTNLTQQMKMLGNTPDYTADTVNCSSKGMNLATGYTGNYLTTSAGNIDTYMSAGNTQVNALNNGNAAQPAPSSNLEATLADIVAYGLVTLNLA